MVFTPILKLTCDRFIGPKYGGIHVFWDGETLKNATTKSVIPVPSYATLPTVSFEGMLW
jgi:hypothetical protein